MTPTPSKETVDCMAARPLCPLSDTEVYLGEGIWWRLSARQAMSGWGRSLPTRQRGYDGVSAYRAGKEARS